MMGLTYLFSFYFVDVLIHDQRTPNAPLDFSFPWIIVLVCLRHLEAV